MLTVMPLENLHANWSTIFYAFTDYKSVLWKVLSFYIKLISPVHPVGFHCHKCMLPADFTLVYKCFNIFFFIANFFSKHYFKNVRTFVMCCPMLCSSILCCFLQFYVTFVFTKTRLKINTRSYILNLTRCTRDKINNIFLIAIDSIF